MNVLDEVKEIAGLMIRIAPDMEIEERVRFYQPLFFEWQHAKNEYQNGQKPSPEKFKVQVSWLLGSMRINKHAEAEQLIEKLTERVSLNDYPVLTAVWESLWDKELVQEVLEKK